MLILAVLAIFTAHLGLALGGTVVTIDASKRFQTIDGFGVSQAFGAASKFKALDPTPRQKGLDLLFNTTTGAGLSIIRNRIGSSKWSWDCIANTSPGSPDKPLDYHWDGVDSGQVWLSQEAMRYGVGTIYANAWSAPEYMKSAEHYGRLCGTRGVTCASGDWRLRYAQLIAQYLTYYKEIGIPITHVGFLNEGDGSDFMLSTAEQAADVIPILHKTLESKGFGSVKITCCDNIGWKSQTAYTQKLAELGADKYLSVITSHAYSSDPKQPMNTTLPTWMTEGSDLRNAFGTAWYSTGALNEGFTWAVKIAEGIVNADLSAYVYWEGLEVNNAKSAAHLIESDGSKVTPSGTLWALAHWSRYIRPGAQRLSTSGNVQDTIIGAFENVDKSIILVLTNVGSVSQTVELNFPGIALSTAHAFTSDNRAQMVDTHVSLSRDRVKVTVPVWGVVTVKLTAANPTGGATQPPTPTSTAALQLTSQFTVTSAGGGKSLGSLFHSKSSIFSTSKAPAHSYSTAAAASVNGVVNPPSGVTAKDTDKSSTDEDPCQYEEAHHHSEHRGRHRHGHSRGYWHGHWHGH